MDTTLPSPPICPKDGGGNAQAERVRVELTRPLSRFTSLAKKLSRLSDCHSKIGTQRLPITPRSFNVFPLIHDRFYPCTEGFMVATHKERIERIELSLNGWKPLVLPLNTISACRIKSRCLHSLWDTLPITLSRINYGNRTHQKGFADPDLANWFS